MTETGSKRKKKKIKELSDKTRLAGQRWSSLKYKAMADGYHCEDWYNDLNEDEKYVLESLISA